MPNKNQPKKKNSSYTFEELPMTVTINGIEYHHSKNIPPLSEKEWEKVKKVMVESFGDCFIASDIPATHNAYPYRVEINAHAALKEFFIGAIEDAYHEGVKSSNASLIERIRNGVTKYVKEATKNPKSDNFIYAENIPLPRLDEILRSLLKDNEK